MDVIWAVSGLGLCGIGNLITSVLCRVSSGCQCSIEECTGWSWSVQLQALPGSRIAKLLVVFSDTTFRTAFERQHVVKCLPIKQRLS